MTFGDKRPGSVLGIGKISKTSKSYIENVYLVDGLQLQPIECRTTL